MKLTVKELKKRIEGLSDDTPVYIERIHDVYFDKYGWTTENVVFDINDDGETIDDTDIIRASAAGGSDTRLMIFAHI